MGFGDQRLVNVGNHATTGDRRLDHRVELLITANGQLQMAWGDAFHLEILAGVAGQFQDFGGEVLENGRAVDCRSCADSAVRTDARLQEPVDPANRELEKRKKVLSAHGKDLL